MQNWTDKWKKWSCDKQDRRLAIFSGSHKLIKKPPKNLYREILCQKLSNYRWSHIRKKEVQQNTYDLKVKNANLSMHLISMLPASKLKQSPLSALELSLLEPTQNVLFASETANILHPDYTIIIVQLE